MNILVTGGAGFIGSNFIRHILVKYPDYKIINLDKLTYAGNLDNLRDIEHQYGLGEKRYGFVRGDICDAVVVDEVVGRKPDAIIHFAAESHVDRSIINSQEFLQTNVLGTRILLEAARKYNVSKFVQIGTDEVYGSIEDGYSKEEDILEPNSPYSASKAAADLLARAYWITFGMPVIITRSSNNFGPYQYPEKLIPLFIINLIKGKKAPLYGDGMNVRDWLHVFDNCEAIDLILHHGKIGEIYNIGGDNERTNIDITRTILDYLNFDENLIEYIKDRPGHDRRYALDSAKIRQLGWEPKQRFEESIKDTIEWYRNNELWWKRIKDSEYNKYYEKQYSTR
ncbi:MAG: dTDP-glucose 4,6-dehydratase [Patescibacteria group bacterium]